MAFKPAPPATVSCSTLSSSGNVYIAECEVRPAGKSLPKGIRFLGVKGKGAKLVSSEGPRSGKGVGKWLITVQIDGNNAVPIVFEINSGANGVKIGGMYHPLGNAQQTVPKKGVVKTDESGRKVQEFPSK